MQQMGGLASHRMNADIQPGQYAAPAFHRSGARA
ncbi:hypothetical protein O987_26880 [Comamonas testosteroni TK102]|uniref:Uncharacterized protein n=1 Tax=Comamonas testosteroni TK102 TaxID=1392005 RepID=A0A076Q162_COMTE|nr:hypothetical protein O987_26880 [Comamonas testosteroni TK102]